MLKVLVVEDESIVAFEISSYLESLDCEVVDIVTNGVDALKRVDESHIDLVLMDIFLEGSKNGIDTALEMRGKYRDIIIIFLTANSDNQNINRAIEVEPLVYLSKPFDRKELYAGVSMAKNRVKDVEMLALDNKFSFDKKNNFLYYKRELISLTKKETQLLSLLIENRNSIVPNHIIEYELWPNDAASSNRIRTLIQRLRMKLNYNFIKTISKRGYIFIF